MLADLPDAAQRILFLSCRFGLRQAEQEEMEALTLGIDNWGKIVETAKKERLAGMLCAALLRTGTNPSIKFPGVLLWA